MRKVTGKKTNFYTQEVIIWTLNGLGWRCRREWEVGIGEWALEIGGGGERTAESGWKKFIERMTLSTLRCHRKGSATFLCSGLIQEIFIQYDWRTKNGGFAYLIVLR